MFCNENRINMLLWFLCLIMASSATGQSASPSTNAAMPTLVNYSGTLIGVDEKPLTNLTGVTFYLYENSQGGAPLWVEMQNVQPNKAGRYSVTLGSTTSAGLPVDVFASGQARWLGIQVQGQEEQARVMLLAVPYALKAGDAETIGGLPPSAFMLATPTIASGSLATEPSGKAPLLSSAPSVSSNVTTTGGTVNAIPLFTAGTNVQNSILTQTAATAINVAGKLNLPANGTATATGGKASRPEDFIASAFNSGSAAAVAQTFQLQAEAAGNNSATPSGTLNLLYGAGTIAPAETGFKINNKGVIAFATGQTFPGTGKGTITGVVPGGGLSGGGTTGTVTLNLDTTKVPELTSNNTFSGTEQFKAAVGIGTTPMANGYTPLSIGTANTFGTWFALANTSTGGHTWNIISAGSGNAEGAGNIGITDLTGKSTIWLEGNTKTTSLTATGGLNAATLVVTATAGSAIIDADGFGQNAGGPTPGLRFGGGGSGEGIASNRVIGLTRFGLDFYTNYTARMSVLQSGQVAVGTASPGAQLGVISSTNAYPGIYVQGGAAASGSGQNGSDGIDAYGNSGDVSSDSDAGGNGIQAFGGSSGDAGGSGGVFTGGSPYGYGVYATGGSDGFAGYFNGPVLVAGNLVNPSIVTRIDDPLDPANKYLSHSSVESSDMKNIYDGNVTTDAGGQAVVELPDWFEALNRDFRYQLTTIGQPAQAWIASKIANHAFTVKTDKPNVEISWQVTGIRQDEWANAHRIPVEAPKLGREAGHYLHPELYGAPEEASIEWAQHPQIMKRQQELRKKSLPTQPNAVTR
jgi:trimeric autotransporter adhesin